MIKAIKEELKQDLIDLIRNHEGLSEERRTDILTAIQHPETQIKRDQLDMFFVKSNLLPTEVFFEKHMTKNKPSFTLSEGKAKPAVSSTKRKEAPTATDTLHPNKKHKK